MKLYKTAIIIAIFSLSIFSNEILNRNSKNSLHFSLSDYSLETVHRNNNNYVRIDCKNLKSSSNIGEAELPCYSFKWAIGKGDLNSVRVTNLITDTVILLSPIIPKQPEQRRSSRNNTFIIDNNYYSRLINLHNTAEIDDNFILRGVKGATVKINPFRYNPINNKLIIIKECDIEFTDQRTEPVIIHSPAFYKLMKETFINCDDVIIADMSNHIENYLIIAESAFHSTLTDFIAYRESKYNVNLLSADQLGGNTMIIIDKIKELYADPSTRPTYLLLVGAFPLLPMCHATSSSSLGSPQNDLWFGAVDGDDYYADIFVGRFSVGSGENSQLANCIRKTIAFEQNSNNAPKDNLYIAAGGPYGDKATGPMNFIDDNYFKPAGFSGVKLYEDITVDISTERVAGLVNDGLSFLFYSGHGNWDHWKTGHFFNSDVHDLSNSSYPIVFSFACLTGDLNTLYGECFGEAWMNANNGASSFIGATTETTWDPDDLFQRTIISAMFEKGFSTMQSAVAYGKVELDKQFPKWGHFYAETFNLCGDPALEVGSMLPVSIDDNIVKENSKSLNQISVNKVGSNLTIKPKGELSNLNSISINIYSLSGKKILSQKSNTSKIEIDNFTDIVSNGLYYGIVKLKYRNKNSQKFTVKLSKF